VLAILPRTRILDILLKLTKFDGFIVVFTIISLHYLLFYDFFASFGLTPHWNLSRWNLNTHNVSYLLVLASAILLFFRASVRPLSKSKILKLKKLIEELTYKKEWGQIIILLDKHLDTLVKLQNPSSFLERPKAKSLDILANSESIERFFDGSGLDKDTAPKRRNNIFEIAIKKFAGIKSESYQRRHDTIHDIFKYTLLNNQFVKELSATQPYLAIRILKSEIRETLEFSNIYLGSLFCDSNSILYRELNNNQNLNSGNRYWLPKENRLLFYLFSDVKVAEKLYAWKPIGESVLSRLTEIGRKPLEDAYNFTYDKETYVRGKCPIYMAVHYFSIMVSEALYQNIKWHMWLFYFRYFVRYICRNYDIDEKYIDVELEFPTRYSYLLYIITTTLRDWISSAENIPMEQENVAIKTTTLGHDNGNIVTSSILALGQSIFTIATTEKIPLKFKKYLIEGIYDLHFKIKLPGIKIDKKYAQTLLKSLLNGGQEHYKDDADYNSLVLDSLLHIDTASLIDGHFEETLNEVANHFLNTHGSESKYTNFKKIDVNTVEVSSKFLQGGYRRTFTIELGS
jgi:hypothetical protein